MKTKDNLLSLLEAAKGSYVSGEDLSSSLGISRTAVWKAASTLREDGYDILSAYGKGYCLSSGSDRLSAFAISQHLQNKVFSITVLPETGSTNNDSKALAEKGASEFTLVASEHQNAGKGRLGRSFYSPEGTGIYFSILLRPRMPIGDALYITTAAAAATSRAIEDVCGKRTGIKWVNDIFIAGKKVCGILTEASIDMESGSLAYAVLGIGINVIEPEGGFPEAISNVAGSVYSSKEYVPGIRSRLLAAVLDNFYLYYTAFPEKAFLEDYRKRSILIGKVATVIRGDLQYPAEITGIDDNCRLLVLREGVPETLDSGEVSVRL
ncbi:MAG: biotin--[acetyl-CoA-carboxylase] ligase [Clostridiaceae bacterium]|nr:biotin--[acetyl-CoA-carboxylase] ligase [Clostridiaceae bacterium]